MVEIVFALWIVTASIVVVVMVRRGHDGPRWAIISFALAPIAPLLASFARYQARATKDTIVEAGEPGEGPLGVLVGIDGSPEATDALRGTLELLANRIGRLHLATVVDYETASNKRRPDRKSADANLAAAAQLASQTSAVVPTTVVLAGPPAAALVQHALGEGLDLLVVGRRGWGRKSWLEGSVARELSREARVRVAILGGEPEQPPAAEFSARRSAQISHSASISQ